MLRFAHQAARGILLPSTLQHQHRHQQPTAPHRTPHVIHALPAPLQANSSNGTIREAFHAMAFDHLTSISTSS
jgi:hypothetical protein